MLEVVDAVSTAIGAERVGLRLSPFNPFIGNPDLPARLQQGLELSGFDPASLYSPGAAGYADYPAHQAQPSPALA